MSDCDGCGVEAPLFAAPAMWWCTGSAVHVHVVCGRTTALIAVRAGIWVVTGVHTSCSTKGTLLGRHALNVTDKLKTISVV